MLSLCIQVLVENNCLLVFSQKGIYPSAYFFLLSVCPSTPLWVHPGHVLSWALFVLGRGGSRKLTRGESCFPVGRVPLRGGLTNDSGTWTWLALKSPSVFLCPHPPAFRHESGRCCVGCTSGEDGRASASLLGNWPGCFCEAPSPRLPL